MIRFLFLLLIAPVAQAQPVLFERDLDIPPFEDYAGLDSMRVLADSTVQRRIREYRASDIGKSQGCLNGIVAHEDGIREGAYRPYAQFHLPQGERIRLVDPRTLDLPRDAPDRFCYIEFQVDWIGGIHRAEMWECYEEEIDLDAIRSVAEDVEAELVYFTSDRFPQPVYLMAVLE